MPQIISEVKSGNTMLFINRKLTFGAVINITYKEGDAAAEEDNSFFAKAATIDEEITQYEFVMYAEPNGEVKILDVNDKKKADFLLDGSNPPSLDSYPDELVGPIKKSVGRMKGLLNPAKLKKGMHYDINKLTPEQETLMKAEPKMADIAADIVKNHKAMMAGIDKERKKNAGVGLGDFLERYAFKKHIMLSGPAGKGKTYEASKWIHDNGYEMEFIAGHSGIESIDLLGYWVKKDDGNLVWMDGALTAAFRKAEKEKTILMYDELLRTPARELSILVGSLTPNHRGEYSLRTNRIIGEVDGIGETETLVIPMENLHVIATTNVGSDYDVDGIDVALQDRFRTHDISMSNETIHSICMDIGETKFGAGVVDKIMNLYVQVETLQEGGNIARSMSIRHLAEILTHCDDPAELRSYFMDLSTILCSRNTDGKLNSVEHKTYAALVKKSI